MNLCEKQQRQQQQALRTRADYVGPEDFSSSWKEQQRISAEEQIAVRVFLDPSVVKPGAKLQLKLLTQLYSPIRSAVCTHERFTVQYVQSTEYRWF